MEYIEETKALVVDDSDFFASLTADQLEREHGVRTVQANSAAEGLKRLESESFDCVISDYDMPDTNGLEFYEQISERDDIPFILLTGRTDDNIVSEAIEAGVDEYIRKEAVSQQDNFEVLANRIDTVVSRRKVRRKYELVVDNTPEGIAQVNRDGTVLAANEAVAETFDCTPEGMVGADIDDVLPAEIAQQWQSYGDEALTSRERVQFKSSHGGRHYDTVIVPVDVRGNDGSYQAITRDITERIERQQELEQTTEQLELINRFVRHDIRNDINLIYAWAEMLSDHVDDTGEEYVEKVSTASDHIAELTDIAADFVEIVSGEGGVETEPVSLSSHLLDEFEKRQQSYEDATFALNHEIPNVRVNANGMIASVFRNLLNNAVQHNDSDDPEVRISVDIDEQAGTATVIIADNGPGVPENQRDSIFGKGKQGAESSGSGIGLYLVHTLVTQYGGEVWVEDSHLGGAAFVVELPLADVEYET